MSGYSFPSASVRNAVHMGCSFMAIFMAFSVSQNFQTSSDHKSEGATALGILYAFFTLANFVSSAIVSSLGSKLCLILGACTYVTFVAANISYVLPLLYISSALLGIGASVLWTAQGAYISNCAALHEQSLGLAPSSTLGYFNGLFFSIFQANQLAGNLLAAALFSADVATGTIFGVMTAICALGTATLLALKDPAKALSHAQAARGDAESPEVASPSPDASSSMGILSPSSDGSSSASRNEDLPYIPAPRRSACSRFLSVFSSLQQLRDVRLLILLPIMCYSGLSQTYIFGDFPPLIEDKSLKFFVLAAIGGVDALSSMAMGRLSDRAGRVLVLCIGFVTALGPIIFLSQWSVDQDAKAVFFLVGIIMGVSDGVYNTQIYAILGTWFEGRAEQAFANFKLFQAGSTAVAFLIDGVLGFYWKCWLTGVTLVVGMLCLALYDLYCRAQGVRGSVLDGARGSGEAEKRLLAGEQAGSSSAAATAGSSSEGSKNGDDISGYSSAASSDSSQTVNGSGGGGGVTHRSDDRGAYGALA